MQTRAAYGCGTNPTVYRVTNLNDSGAGSLRAALTASGPRVVVFEVSGYIDIVSQINIDSPCLTVAGQTAPSPGITIRVNGTYPATAMILVWTHDTLFQHLRIRPGDSTCNSGLQYYDGGSGMSLYNNVLDHMSVSWAQDEGVTWVTSAHDSTLWRSIIGEVLRYTSGSSACEGGGLAANGIGVGTGNNISILQNLLAHNVSRNPQIDGSGSGAFQNNVVYAPALGPWWMTQPGRGAFRWRADGNYMKTDSNTNTDNNTFAFAARAVVSGSQLYLGDNRLDGGPYIQFTPFIVIAGEGIDPRVSSPPISVPGYAPLSSGAAYSQVLANAGARPADRDGVDARIVRDVQNRTGNYVSKISEVGGYPALAVNRRTLTLPDNPHTATASGYTNLEKWLQGYAATVEGGAAATQSAPQAPTNVRISSN